MNGTALQSFVSSTIDLGYADAAEAIEKLVGQEISTGSTRLVIEDQLAGDVGGATWFAGVLRSSSPLARPIRVDVVVSPWSAHRTEIGIRPLARLGHLDSLRTRRFVASAWDVLPQLTGRLDRPVVAERELVTAQAA